MKLDIGKWYLGITGDDDQYWNLYIFHWLDKDVRYWGRSHVWYDGPWKSFGLWFFNITWRFPWNWKEGGY